MNPLNPTSFRQNHCTQDKPQAPSLKRKRNSRDPSDKESKRTRNGDLTQLIKNVIGTQTRSTTKQRSIQTRSLVHSTTSLDPQILDTVKALLFIKQKEPHFTDLQAFQTEAHLIAQNKASSYISLGQYQKAIEVCQSIELTLIDNLIKANLLASLTSAYIKLGQYQRVIDTFQTVDFNSLDNQTKAKLTVNLTSAHNNLGQYEKAVEACQGIDFNSLDNQTKAGLAINLTLAHNLLDQREKAVEICQSVNFSLLDDQIRAKLTINLTSVYNLLGQYEKTLEICQDIDFSLLDESTQVKILRNLMFAHIKLDQRQIIDLT